MCIHTSVTRIAVLTLKLILQDEHSYEIRNVDINDTLDIVVSSCLKTIFVISNTIPWTLSINFFSVLRVIPD